MGLPLNAAAGLEALTPERGREGEGRRNTKERRRDRERSGRGERERERKGERKGGRNLLKLLSKGDDVFSM